jgi:hypothetical protein
MTVTVLEGQSFFDLAMIYAGDALSAYGIAGANNRGVTDRIVAGERVVIPEGIAVNKAVVNYYASRRISSATAPGGMELDRIFDLPFPLEFS